MNKSEHKAHKHIFTVRVLNGSSSEYFKYKALSASTCKDVENMIKKYGFRAVVDKQMFRNFDSELVYGEHLMRGDAGHSIMEHGNTSKLFIVEKPTATAIKVLGAKDPLQAYSKYYNNEYARTNPQKGLDKLYKDYPEWKRFNELKNSDPDLKPVYEDMLNYLERSCNAIESLLASYINNNVETTVINELKLVTNLNNIVKFEPHDLRNRLEVKGMIDRLYIETYKSEDEIIYNVKIFDWKFTFRDEDKFIEGYKTDRSYWRPMGLYSKLVKLYIKDYIHKSSLPCKIQLSAYLVPITFSGFEIMEISPNDLKLSTKVNYKNIFSSRDSKGRVQGILSKRTAKRIEKLLGLSLSEHKNRSLADIAYDYGLSSGIFPLSGGEAVTDVSVEGKASEPNYKAMSTDGVDWSELMSNENE